MVIQVINLTQNIQFKAAAIWYGDSSGNIYYTISGSRSGSRSIFFSKKIQRSILKKFDLFYHSANDQRFLCYKISATESPLSVISFFTNLGVAVHNLERSLQVAVDNVTGVKIIWGSHSLDKCTWRSSWISHRI